ncbi:hypothetical protein [Ancylobacter defluvii]|uniref:Uncharacterized protein n=1 Tax=Ancylobacter defluvii TaxID=1282440 RepID=A0A9W6NC96_9HYPH|nr:hypothetical protein [Ancylobacter defluvii]MBS7588887.1 hypothetical protein [Ancylobacter defluvii]GLK86349.1 hypothetical protein GCM10017653_44190 [Ancylobacter defluvii]
MSAQPNIERIIDEAIVLADLTGPQTGTAPTPRAPRFLAPVDQTPVEFTGEECDRIFAQLPFITNTPTGRNFWAVEPAGNSATDCAVAAAHGATLVAAMQSPTCSYFTGRVVLGWVLADIAEKGNAAHLAGFLGALSEGLTRHCH